MASVPECVACQGARTDNWYAWNNLTPPKPDDFHVVGDVEVANPGIEPILVARVPQGINSRILLLDLVLVQQPGNWIQLVVTKQARYDRINVTFDQAQVFCDREVIADIKVKNIQ